MALVRTPRADWVAEGLKALANGGPAAIRIESLARSLGVTKGGFYWHFSDRQTLLDEVLDAWERLSVDEAIQLVDAHPGDGRAKLSRLFTLAGEHDELRRTDLAVRDWARRDAAVAQRLRRVDNRRMEYMRGLFRDFCSDADEIEARCLVLMTLFVGMHFVAVDHPAQSRIQVLRIALHRLLE